MRGIPYIMNSAKSEQLLEALPEGYSNYVKICLDPFHDKTIHFSGAPTSRSATSVTLCLTQEQTYAADDFPNINQPTWDAHFAMFPFLQNHQLGLMEFTSDPSTFGNPPLITLGTFATGPAYNIYPMSVHGVNSGTPTYASPAGAGIDVFGLDLSSLVSYISNPNADVNTCYRAARIVGESFEVIDESPEIYQQGAVTVYRYPLDVDPAYWAFQINNVTGSTWDGDGDNQRWYSNAYFLRTPPTNTATAVLVPGSETWKAKDGVYVVGTQYQSEVPFKQMDMTPIAVIGSCPSASPNFVTGYYKFIDQNWKHVGFHAQGPTANNPGHGENYNKPDAVYPFNLSGAYFTGLSSQYGVLRLRYRAYVEILTDPMDNSLAPLSRPTLPYEQAISELVMGMLLEQPAGVPQYKNGSGIKWKEILGTLGKSAQKLAPVLSTLSPEVGLILQGGGQGLVKIANAMPNKKAGNKKKVTPNAKAQPKAAPKAQPA